MTPLVTVIIPTHNHATTVDLTVQSVLAQTVTELDVVVIGDGATEETRAAVNTLTSDPRVRFLDRPKSPSRGEETRHEVLTAARSPFVCYLGDDDLALPDHVETMIGLLEEADFAHPPPLMVAPDGSLWAIPTDIARRECVQWHLHPKRNAISLTGAAHRLDAYRRLPHGWRTPPPGRASDHYMWEQWFRTPGMRFTTGDRLTVLKLVGAVRKEMGPAERRAEMLAWKARAEQEGFPDELARLASDTFRRCAVDAVLELAALHDSRIWRLHEWLFRIPGVQRVVAFRAARGRAGAAAR